jgi:hypothetical protein
VAETSGLPAFRLDSGCAIIVQYFVIARRKINKLTSCDDVNIMKKKNLQKLIWIILAAAVIFSMVIWTLGPLAY